MGTYAFFLIENSNEHTPLHFSAPSMFISHVCSSSLGSTCTDFHLCALGLARDPVAIPAGQM